MTRFKTIALISALIALTTSDSILGADRFAVSVNPEMANQILTTARAAEQDGNFAGALRDYRRCLELYPNEPLLQAPIYLAMGAAAGKAGDQTQAKELTQIAQTLDPNVSSRVAKAAPEAVTRGGKADTAIAIFAGVMSAVQQARAARAQQMQNAPPANYSQPPGGNYGYPAAPVGDPGYAAPPNGYAPMPGYGQPAPGQPSPYGNPGAQPHGQQPGYGQAPPGQPYGGNPQTQPYGQQPSYGQPAPGQYPPQGQNPYGAYAPPPAPYGAPSGYSNGYGATRGEAAPKPLKVIHDHSQLGDKSYFEKGCGALVAVTGGNLTFTPSGGEAPLVIPTSEIREIRLNSTVGREIGAFHIATKQGLYLNLAPASANRDDGRADVNALLHGLGLSN